MKLSLSFLLFSILLIDLSGAKAQFFPIKELHAKSWDQTEYIFPELSSTTEAAKKINIYLKGAELNILQGKYKKTPFEQILPAKNSNLGITMLTATILKNSPAVFSVSVSNEYTSASLNYYTSIYNFNSQTGDPLNLSDLFTPAGYQLIRKQIIAGRMRKLDSYLKTLNTKNEEAAIAYNTYKECLEQMPSDDLNNDRLSFEKDGIQLERQSCFPDHYGQSLSDHAAIYVNKLSLKTIIPYLSAYGKLLVTGKSTKGVFAEHKMPVRLGVYQGKINGQYAITLLLTRNTDSNLHACYFYDLRGQKINLYGSIKNQNTVLLATSDVNDPEAEKFELKVLPNGSLNGTWSKSTKTFKVELL